MFVHATTATDIEAVDNLRLTVEEAARHRAADPALKERSVHCLVTAAKLGSDAAMLELVARHEARIRSLVSRYRTGDAPDQDRQQAALIGFMEAVKTDNNAGEAGLFTLAHYKIVHELREVNAAYSAKPTERHAEGIYWTAMHACDSDVAKARRYADLMRRSINELEPLAEDGDMLAREIIDARVDRWEARVRRNPEGTPAWDDFAAERGRGLDGPTFDTVHGEITYIDASAVDHHEDVALTDPAATEGFEIAEGRLAMAQLLATLEGRDAEIMAAYLAGKTDRETADELGISRARVVNIRRAIIARLKKLANA